MTTSTTDPNRVLFSSPLVRAGVFRCRPTHPAFSGGPEPCDMVVFPATVVRVARSGDRTRVVDPTMVLRYRKGESVRREAVNSAGESSTWFAVSPTIAEELRRAMPANHPLGMAPSDLYHRQRILIEDLRRPGSDRLAAEERILTIFTEALGGIEAGSERRTPEAHHDLADRARERLGRDLGTGLSLGELAAGLGTSPGHLCRVFRQVTGRTLATHRRDLRLREALARLTTGPADLSEIAFSLGFASHSHFTLWFRRVFGTPPSALGRRLSVG